MDFTSFKRELLAHYMAMASLPWAREAAIYSAKDLAARFPNEFGKLPKALDAALKEKSDAVRS